MSAASIFYGTLTGNTQAVAEKIAEICLEKGKEVETINIAEADSSSFAAAPVVILASSTWDDGHLQADWGDFVERTANENINLTGKKIAVFGCGDSNYTQYCKAADLLEQYAVERGGQKMLDTLKIDGFPNMEDNQAKIRQWAEQLSALL